MLDRIVEKLYGEEAGDVLAVKLAGLYSARRARLLARAEDGLREAEDLLGLPSPSFSLRMLPPPWRVPATPEKLAEWSTPLSGVPGSGPLLGGLAAGLGDRDAVSGLGTGFGSLLGQSAGGALGGMLGPHAGRAIAKALGEDKDVGAMWGRTLGTLGGSALGGALGGYVGRQQTRPAPAQALQEGPQAGERRASYKLARVHGSDLLSMIPGAGPTMGGLQAAYQTDRVRPGLGTMMGGTAGQIGGALLGGMLTRANPLGVIGGMMAGGGLGAHLGRSQAKRPDLAEMLRTGSYGQTKEALSPMQTLLSRAVAPAAIGGLAAYAASPQDPGTELRNSLTGAGIGGTLGLLHALHRSFSADPQLASELMRRL